MKMAHTPLIDLLSKYYYDENSMLYLHHTPELLYDRLKDIAGDELSEIKGSKKQKLQIIREFLQQQRGYTLFRSSKTPTKRNPYRVWALDLLWEIDLAAFPKLASANNNITYLLVCIDTFSRFAFVRPVRSKHPHEIVKALHNIFIQSNRKPYQIQSDAGKEFLGKDMQNFLHNQNIKFRVVQTTLKAKASLVERFNRTLRERIVRYLNWRHYSKQSNENRYIDALPMIVDDYNRSKHTSLGKLRPIDVKKENAVMVYKIARERIEKQIHKKSVQKRPPKFQIGDFVRVQRKRDLFEKLSKSIWSDEIFQINRVIRRQPFTVYEIIDLRGNVVKGKLYERELQRIQLAPDTPVKIIQRPSIFSKQKTFKVQTLDGNVRDVDLKTEQENRNANNYVDLISSLTKIKIK